MCDTAFHNLRSRTTITILSALAGIMLLVGLAPSQAQAALLEPLKYGAWKGGVYTNDKTGRFSHCVVSANYKSGIKLLFSVTRGQYWSMGFSKKSWKLDIGKSYPILYQVDKKKALKGNAKARGKSLAVVNLPPDNKIFNQMRRGRLLRVKAGDDILSFNLKGTNRVLQNLLDCSRKNNDLIVDKATNTTSKSTDSENPFSTEPLAKEPKTKPRNQFAAVRPVTAEDRNDGKIWFNTYLVNSDVLHRSVTENEKSAKLYKTYAQLWLSGPKGKTIGSMRILNKKDSDFFAKNFPAHRKELCGGKYTFRIIPNEIKSAQRILRFVATCKLEGKPLKTFYHMLANRDSGGSYFISLISDKVPTPQVERAGNDVAMRMLSLKASASATVGK